MSGKGGPIPGATFPDGAKKLAGNFKIPKKSNTTGGTSGASTSATNAGPSGSGSNNWTTVGGKKKGRSSDGQTGGKGKATASAGTLNPRKNGPTSGTGRATAPAGTPTIPREVREMWAREKRCLGCGSESHWKSSCPLGAAAGAAATPSTSAPSKGPKGKGAKAPKLASNQDGRGVKRARDPAPTGQTPPAKKPAAKKFSYAAAATSALEMAIVTREMGHVSKKDFDKLRTLVEDEWLVQLEQGKEPFEVEQWLYTNQLATFAVPNDRSVADVSRIVNEQGFTVVPKAEVLEKRRPTKILTGLVTGSAANRDRATLERLLKFEVERVGVRGRLEFYSAHPIQKSGNLLLKIILDDRAMDCLKERDFELRIGASGRVRFSDERADKKTSRADKLKAQKEELVKEYEATKDAMRTMYQKIRALEAEETESIGSLGVSDLTVETEEMDTEKEQKQSEGEDSK